MARRKNPSRGNGGEPPKRPPDEPPPDPSSAPIAPWPSLDRYPTVLGSNLTLAYLSSVYRLCQTGYRREYVDALDELLERDPHAYAVLAQRILAVAGGRLTLNPAECDESEAELAKRIADECQRDVLAIQDLRQALAALLWAIFYGVTSSEIGWRITDHWWPERLYWIHSRRLHYPDPSSWSVRIWDLGFVWGFETNSRPDGTGLAGYGIPAEDYPGKFITHAPQLRGDYPTRDGVGREIAYYMAIKGMAARGGAQFVERFGKPWPIAQYTTGDPEVADGKPRAATNADINIASAAIQGVGAGNLSGAVVPDSVDLAMLGPATSSGNSSTMIHAQWIQFCNGEISKAVLGNTDTTEAGENGSRAATETRKRGTMELYRYDAACLADTLKRDLVWWWVHLNYPGKEYLCPTVTLTVEQEPTPKEIAEVALTAVQAGLPVDADKLADRIGIPLVSENAEGTTRRAALVKPTELSSIDKTITPPPPKLPPPGFGKPNQPPPAEEAQPVDEPPKDLQ